MVIRGKWVRVNDYNKDSGVEGVVEFKDNEINVDFKNNPIISGVIYRTKFNGKYYILWGNKTFFGGKGKAVLAIESTVEIDIAIENKAVKEIVLDFPNLKEWLGGDGIKKKDDKYYPRDNIEVKKNEVYIETYLYVDEAGLLKTKPVLKLILDEAISLAETEKYISDILKFFGVLIGRIDHIEEIYLKWDNVEEYIRYYSTMNNSHMTEYDTSIMFTRTSYKDLEKDITFYYSKWCEFYKKYKLVVDHYFKSHVILPITTEEIFLSWCNTYDGYWIHSKNIDINTKKFEKKIKEVLKKDEIKEAFTELFKEFNLEFEPHKVASKIKKEIETVKSLGEVIKIVFKDNYDLINKNINDLKCDNKGISEEQIYESINKTRNFYTHLKQDASGILNYKQIGEMNKLFYCTFIIILLKGMGFDGEELQRTLRTDNIISFHKI